ncbi:MAG TPA: 1,4-alpha-glucan branching protein domain-containing protein [Clostridia bacterium]|nr:1,4-alpha-glucan branching protein domain-containing protein [Clostridia bacterium]
MLHAHLPFVRHPEHDRFLEENWLFEAITECYLPLLRVLQGWQRDGVTSRIALSLTPTLCAMLGDPLLQRRYRRHLDELIELADKEAHRNLWQPALHDLAHFYHARFVEARLLYEACGGELLRAFRQLQDEGQIEIITSAATHALLPLLARHRPSLRAQVQIARADYRRWFERDPRGIWLPECAYVEGLEEVLAEANLRWFVTDTHGILNARPRPRYAIFAPVFTPHGVAAFGRDHESARQVWSRHEGYPGDQRYRDFYRDIGFDVEMDYLRPHLPAPECRGFTGIKYHRITGGGSPKELYDPPLAQRAADEHAGHFLSARMAQVQRLAAFFDRPPLVVSPYDAELFGHWWYEGPAFLDLFVRKAHYDQTVLRLITPEDYLREHPTNQLAVPAASSWGEDGYWRVWLNEKNQWIYRLLGPAQEQMSELAGRFVKPDALQERGLKQAARELLLAQASDWPFILRTGTSPDYASQRVRDHLARFGSLFQQLTGPGLDEQWLAQIEERDNLFPDMDYRWWRQ